MHTVYLSMELGHLVARVDKNPAQRQVLTTYDQYYRVCNEDVCSHIVVSSSVDFPREYTSDPATMALCRQIRNEG